MRNSKILTETQRFVGAQPEGGPGRCRGEQYVSTSMVLLPLWFALLGLGLGGVESIESQHAEFYGTGGGGASELEEGTSADGSGGKPQPQQPEAAAM